MLFSASIRRFCDAVSCKYPDFEVATVCKGVGVLLVMVTQCIGVVCVIVPFWGMPLANACHVYGC